MLGTDLAVQCYQPPVFVRIFTEIQPFVRSTEMIQILPENPKKSVAPRTADSVVYRVESQKVFFLDQRVVYLITFNNDRNFYDYDILRRFVVLNNIVSG